jgi:hypothetical protein
MTMTSTAMATAIRTRIFMSFLRSVKDWLENSNQDWRRARVDNVPPLYEGKRIRVVSFRPGASCPSGQLTIFLRTRFAPLRNPCAL